MLTNVSLEENLTATQPFVWPSHRRLECICEVTEDLAELQHDKV